MKTIRSVLPLMGYRLFMEMESGSSVTVDLSVKLDTLRYRALEDEALFRKVWTDGDYVIWGDGRVRVTAQELIDIVVIGNI
jgi:hypothetical protein